MDLSDFLLARIDEDEATVRGAIEQPPSPDEAWVGGQLLAAALQLALQDCAVKRQLVGHETARGKKDFRPTVEPADTPVLRLLASQYADHPDYQHGWAP